MMIATSYPIQRTDLSDCRPSVRAHGLSEHGEPNYTARRIAAASVAVALLALALVTLVAVGPALVDVGGRPAVASDIDESAGAARNVRTHVAQPGDTLWSIASRYRGDVGQDRFVDALISLNGGIAIQAGQAVQLP